MKLLKISLSIFPFLLLPMIAVADQGAVSVLNELLKGEISAVETYRQALEKMNTDPAAPQLRKYHEEHQNAVKAITQEVVKLGGKPETSSGAWGTWAQAVTGTAKVFGKETALRALKEGEEHGVKEYNEVLKNENAPLHVKSMVRETLLPKQQAHIQGLSRMIDEKQSS